MLTSQYKSRKNLGIMLDLTKFIYFQTNILLPFRTLCRKEEYFPDPEKFLPERWLRKDGTRNTDINPWVYQPFGFGPRSCVGKRLADLEMEILLCKVRICLTHTNIIF